MVLADAQALFAVLNDLALYRFMAGAPPSTVAELAKTIARREAHNATPEVEPCLNWALWLPSGLPLGHLQATVAAGEAWLGYALASSHWGQGYATEAVRGLVAHLQAVWGLARCLGVAEAENAASIRVLHKLGFRLAIEEEREARILGPTERLYILDLPASSASSADSNRHDSSAA
jgi:RimJ/RimL family protein N-acetyltransferase